MQGVVTEKLEIQPGRGVRAEIQPQQTVGGTEQNVGVGQHRAGVGADDFDETLGGVIDEADEINLPGSALDAVRVDDGLAGP
ncbi:hypothetical protein ACFL6C_12640, partial [Myxococcota bacterium]